jgi:hypothetical protein
MNRDEDDRTERTEVVDRRAGTTTAERRHAVGERDYDEDHRRGRPALGIDRERQRAAYGGFNVGAAFFGWLVAVGVAVLLTALLSAAGAAIGLTDITDGEVANAETLSVVGAILLVLVAAISYFAGGYVAGRMSRFDGGRQGLGVWLMALGFTILLAVLGVIAGSEYNVFGSLDLPRIPIDEGDLTTGGLITLLVIAVVTALAAIGGGKAGERYHRRVDAVGLHRD